MEIVKEIVNKGVTLTDTCHQENDAMTIAAQNCMCKLSTLVGLKEMGLVLNKQC